MKDYEVFIPCSCRSEYMRLGHDANEYEVDVSIWKQQYAKSGFWYRIRHAWHILVHGRPYGDQMVFTQAEVEYLQACLDAIMVRFQIMEAGK